MGVETTVTTTWKCERCAKAVVQKSIPCSPNDAWGRVMIDQPSGFDFGGTPWAPRMRDPLLMCGACIEEVVAVINRRPQ